MLKNIVKIEKKIRFWWNRSCAFLRNFFVGLINLRQDKSGLCEDVLGCIKKPYLFQEETFNWTTDQSDSNMEWFQGMSQISSQIPSDLHLSWSVETENLSGEIEDDPMFFQNFLCKLSRQSRPL